MTRLLTHLVAVLIFGTRLARFVLEPDYITPRGCEPEAPVLCDAGGTEPDVIPITPADTLLEEYPLPPAFAEWIKGKGLR